MSRILRRPMFRGGSTNEGIMSVPRRGYENGTDQNGVQSRDTVDEVSSSEDSIDKTLAKELLRDRPDPLGKFLISFGQKYAAARPRGGRFGLITTAAEAAQKPTEQLYSDLDTERLFKLKLYSAMSKKESTIADVKRAKAAAETRNAPNSPYKGLSYNDAYQRAFQDILASQSKLKQLTDPEKVREIQKSFGQPKDERQAANFQRIAELKVYLQPKLSKVKVGNKIVDESVNLDLNNPYLDMDVLADKPNSTDLQLPKPTKADLEEYKIGRVYIDKGRKQAYKYVAPNVFRPLEFAN